MIRPITASSLRYEHWPDPEIAEHTIGLLYSGVQMGDMKSLAQADQMLSLTQMDATWSASVARASLGLAQGFDMSQPARFPEFERIVRAAALADPETGLWYALAAVEANRLGLDQEAYSYAERALEYPGDNESRELLDSLLGGAQRPSS